MKRNYIIVALAIFLSLFFVAKKETDKTPVSKELTLDGVVVVVDPGHGGLDNGAMHGGIKEDELNLKISLALKAELESRGAKVYLTREDDQDMTKRDYNYSKQDDMYLRVRQIDEYNPNYLISIHLNSAPVSSAWGSQVFYFNRSENGKQMATYIHESMKEITGTRKNISGSAFHVLRATKATGVLIECGFLSNGNERGQLCNANYHTKLAISICDGLEKYHKSLINQI